MTMTNFQTVSLSESGENL